MGRPHALDRGPGPHLPSKRTVSGEGHSLWRMKKEPRLAFSTGTALTSASAFPPSPPPASSSLPLGSLSEGRLMALASACNIVSGIAIPLGGLQGDAAAPGTQRPADLPPAPAAALGLGPAPGPACPTAAALIASVFLSGGGLPEWMLVSCGDKQGMLHMSSLKVLCALPGQGQVWVCAHVYSSAA